jgi:hypothetical protein
MNESERLFSRKDADVERAKPNEERFKEKIESLWNVSLWKDVRVEDGLKREDTYQPLDYIILHKDAKPLEGFPSDKVIGYIEMKIRNDYWGHYPSVILDHSKMMSIRKKAVFTRHPIFIFTRWTRGDSKDGMIFDKDVYMRYNPKGRLDFQLGIDINYGKSRTKNDRGDAYDVREVELLPNYKFKDLKQIDYEPSASDRRKLFELHTL